MAALTMAVIFPFIFVDERYDLWMVAAGGPFRAGMACGASLRVMPLWVEMSDWAMARSPPLHPRLWTPLVRMLYVAQNMTPINELNKAECPTSEISTSSSAFLFSSFFFCASAFIS